MNVPGCYSSPTIYSSESEHCKNCSVFMSCGGEAIKTLERLRASVNVESLMRRHLKAATKVATKRVEEKQPAATPAVAFEQMSASLQAKVASISSQNGRLLAVALASAGVLPKLQESLPRGVNPISPTDRVKWLIPFTDRLLAGPATRGELRDACMNGNEWSKGTAESQVSIIVAVMTAFEVIERLDDDRFKLKGR